MTSINERGLLKDILESLPAIVNQKQIKSVSKSQTSLQKVHCTYRYQDLQVNIEIQMFL